jgi:porphobilinogen synthase
MPGIEQLSVDRLSEEAREVAALGIKAVILFGVPATKDPHGLESFADDGVVQQAIRTLKDAHPDIVVVTDVCLCEYTDHGHCGFSTTREASRTTRRSTSCAESRSSHAEAGADVVAPSGMIDGMVGAIRGALDEEGSSASPSCRTR